MFAIVVRHVYYPRVSIVTRNPVRGSLKLMNHDVHAERVRRRQKLGLTGPLTVPPHPACVRIEVLIVLLIALAKR